MEFNHLGDTCDAFSIIDVLGKFQDAYNIRSVTSVTFSKMEEL